MGGAAQSPDPAALTQQDARVISEEIHSLTLRMQVSSLIPEGSKKRKSFPSPFSALRSVCYSKMFLFVSAILNSEEVNLPSLRIKLTLQQSITRLYFLYSLSFFPLDSSLLYLNVLGVIPVINYIHGSLWLHMQPRTLM